MRLTRHAGGRVYRSISKVRVRIAVSVDGAWPGRTRASANVINQYLAARLVDELELHVVPLLRGGEARLFEGVGRGVELEQVRAIEARGVIHLKYRVVN